MIEVQREKDNVIFALLDEHEAVATFAKESNHCKQNVKEGYYRRAQNNFISVGASRKEPVLASTLGDTLHSPIRTTA